jgi:hypothetical protein
VLRPAPQVRRGELQEFLRHVAARGFAVADFQVSAHESVSATGREPVRVISISRQQFGRDFAVTANDGWVTAAVQALREGHFGRP